MDVLPEVLRFAISKACSTGMKLSWTMWENGDYTGIKLFWKPEESTNGGRSDDPASRSTALTHRKKKKPSPSTQRRNARRRESFLNHKKMEENNPGSRIGDSQPSLLSNAHPTVSPPTDVSPKTIIAGDRNSELDLSTCTVVECEQQGEIPGVKFTTASGDEGWTPVVSRRRKKCVSATSLRSAECSESSDDELQSLKSARSVRYEERGGAPGLLVRRGCTMSSRKWRAIVPSPIATRTRTRVKHNV